MARNVNKIKVNLTSAQKASIPSAAGALLTKLREFTDSAPKTAEGEIAFTDEDTSARYIIYEQSTGYMLITPSPGMGLQVTKVNSTI